VNLKTTMRIVISSGHGAKVAGATGYIQEVPEARRVVARCTELMRQAGAEVVEYHEDNAGTQSANVSAIISYHNSHLRDLDVSVHFNHSGGGNLDKAIGTETLYASQAQLAEKVSGAIADASGLLNRGAKHRNDLSFLVKTTKPAIMIEVCFVNSREDVRLYQANFEQICSAIADAILGKPTNPVA